MTHIRIDALEFMVNEIKCNFLFMNLEFSQEYDEILAEIPLNSLKESAYKIMAELLSWNQLWFSESEVIIWRNEQQSTTTWGLSFEIVTLAQFWQLQQTQKEFKLQGDKTLTQFKGEFQVKKKFSSNFFSGDLALAEFLLWKRISDLHCWEQ